jgi:general secretion pathway protein I
MTRPPRPRGFTLLEVLIALAVVALALTALVRVAGQQADALGRERDLTLATWLATDVVTEAKLREAFPATGRRTGRGEQGGQPWRWELVVSGTDQPGVRRLEVKVFPEPSAPDAPSVVTLTGFAGQQ